MALLKFLKGNYSSLNSKAIAEGQILICGDTGEMFVDVAADKRVKIGDFSVIDTLANLEALDASSVPTSRLYYVEDGNILARSNGSAWIQINKQPTADQIKTMIGLADYETKTNASAKLTEAKEYTDGKIGVLGSDSEGNAYANVKAYVDAKTSGIATDAALGELQRKVETAEGEIDALQAAIAEEGSVTKAIADAKKAGTDAQAAAEAAQATADKKATLDEVKALDYATKAEAQGYADAKDDAIAAAQKAGDDAQDAVDALAGKVGTVGEGETVVGMIGEVNTLAGDAMREAQAKVASVSAADNSVTIGGTDTAPTVAAKLSADADNALKLVDDGLKVVIPAAAEYSIVKDENAGDYAAVYHLTKGGVNVGAAINIPKDMVVKSGSVVGDEIVLVLNDEANTEIKINVASLIEYVTSGSQTGDMVVISIDGEHKVTASITDGSITLAKLSTEIQTAIGKAHSHDNNDVLDGINATMVEAWNKAEQNAKDHANGLNTAMNTRVEALEAIDHDHANKALLDTYTQTEADLADAVAKKHAHENAEELAKIAEGDVAKWNAAEQNAKDHANAEIKKLAEGDVADNAAAIAAINNTESGILAQAKAYTDTEAAKKADAEAVYTKEEVDAAIEAAKTDAANKDAVVLAEAQKGIDANAAAVAKNAEDIAKKANASDVYAKTETYTQEEVNAAIEDALTAANSWGEF